MPLPTKKKASAKKKRSPGRKAGASPSLDPVPLVTSILKDYAHRGVFRGFAPGPVQDGKAFFQVVWHRDRRLDLNLDTRKRTLTFPVILPAVPPDMFAGFTAYLESQHDPSLLPHRLVDRSRAVLKAVRKARTGDTSLSIESKDGDYEYATRKLIGVADDTFKTFIHDGPYFDYQVAHLGLDPDMY